MTDADKLRGSISRAKRLVFFGGAGVSTASGIPDFRSSDGLYAMDTGGPTPEEILSASFFALHTREFYDFYRRYMIHPDAEPSLVHRWLYDLEKQDKLRAVITQNIDGLHRKAGNRRVYELHGSIHENYCMGCEAQYGLSEILEQEGVPHCRRCGGVIKPYVTLYGEPLDIYTSIGARREISGADTMIIAGTSLAVEPAASFIEYFSGRELIVINKEPTPADERATLLVRGDVEKIIKEMLTSGSA